MRETRVTLPELALIGGTRAALGAGIGLLLADCLTQDQRRAVGWTLLLVGAISTVPLAVEILAGLRPRELAGWPKQPSSESRAESRELSSQFSELSRG